MSVDATRPTTLATNGIVATPHYLASQAGLRVLQDGGNAVDAAVAANAVLQVVFPHNCSAGGDAFWLIYEPRDGRVAALNGSGRAPAAASLEAIAGRGLTMMPQVGPLTVTVPGCVDSWREALARYGTRPLGDLLAPAIDYAEHGFAATPRLARAIAESAGLLARSPGTAAAYLPGGAPPRPGDRLANPALAGTYRALARGGRDAFYRGPIGEAIAGAVRELGGLLSIDDLAEHRSDWVEPLRGTYRGVEVCEFPPNSQGLTALIELNIAEGFDLAALPPRGADWIHLLVEAKRLAFADRDRYISDPAFVEIPVARLLSSAYADEQRVRVDPRRAAPAFLPGNPAGGDTIYLCTVDRDGRCVSLIQSLYGAFGSGIAAGDTGVILQNRGAYFSLLPGHPNQIAPRKRTLHTLMPGLALRDGKPWLVFGSMGGDGQAQIHLQLLTNLLDAGLGVQQAIDAPRWIGAHLVEAHGPEPLLIEDRVPGAVRADLAARGHDVVTLGAWEEVMGHAQMILLDPRGHLAGGADPRGDGIAAGW